ncbi:UDP-N-acetylmuramoyl-L-alanine--D-glutamate ligase [Carnimonas bestiolae]|uniref:UDP-N-acetylmuramoyl-L-alanine--D-glutamate ligase n=1 Tax=Carnimonas bestiolae TaxID=3402172 RepID=UPI003EDC6C4C
MADGATFHVPPDHLLVVGLGVSGMAIARHLKRQGIAFVMADSREQPAGAAQFRREFGEVPLYCGDLDEIDMSAATEVVISPGIDPHQAVFAQVRERLIGELTLFTRALPSSAKVIAITGSNAKSTVTTLVGDIAGSCGVDVGVGGNLGTPALTLLAHGHELYVLELSSFQLEMVGQLAPDVACFLNLSEDHLDRHGDMAGYRAAKQRIFEGAQCAVVNRDDRASWPSIELPTYSFGVGVPEGAEWGIAVHHGEQWLCQGEQPWLPVSALQVAGVHNVANVLAALAISVVMDWPREVVLAAVARFRGLPHRVEVIGERAGVRYINDSKGTNVGASLAAIEGIAATIKGNIIWLGGGVGKGADFSPLAPALAAHAKVALLFGRDASLLEASLAKAVACQRFASMEEALSRGAELAQAGDAILLSPACASLDQFANYEARGDAFRAWFERQGESSAHAVKE